MKNEKQTASAERLSQIMNERGLRQSDILRLAEPYCKEHNVSLSKSNLSQYIHGVTEPTQEKLVILGMALNVSEGWLMGLNVPKERSTRPRTLSLEEFTDDEVAEIYKYLDFIRMRRST